MWLVRVGYVDGTVATGAPEDWRSLRADGVDWVEVAHVRFLGKSAYWLYREGADWIAGAASFYQDAHTDELVIRPGGEQALRPIEWVPDLRHGDVKLGWWRPGEARPNG